jgi:CubicO group peptidase (beta-lactamase class C family)
VATLALLVACTTDADSPQASPAAPDTQAACPPELDDAFGAWADAGFSGSVAITSGGEPDCLAAYGSADRATDTPNTVDTVFSIGSVTKAFTAATIFDLIDDGSLSLTDRAGDLVPDLTGPVADATVEQLLLHTSGLTGSHGADHEPLTRDEAVAAIGGLGLAFAPGSGYLYSNAGYTLLAIIVEEVAGTSYRDHATSEILRLPDGAVAGGFWDGEPAAPGPRAVGYRDDGSTGESGDFAGPHWAVDGNGALAMTTRDLATWTHALFTGQVVSPASADAIGSAGVDLGDGRSETPGWVAYDASIYGEPALASAGGGGDVGHNAVVAWLPESGRVVAIASNTPEVTAEALLQAVAPALVAGDPLPTPAGPAGDVDPSDLAAAAGTYGLETGGSWDVTVEDDDELAISATGADAVAALFPLPDGYGVDDVAGHEERVRAMLAGETQQGREEREALESDVGPIDDVELVGTIVDGGELRTYVTITSGDESVPGWYALDEEGGIAAVQLDAAPPTLVVAPSGDGAYRPVDPTGSGPDVTVAFRDGGVTVTGPTGSTDARLSG